MNSIELQVHLHIKRRNKNEKTRKQKRFCEPHIETSEINFSRNQSRSQQTGHIKKLLHCRSDQAKFKKGREMKDNKERLEQAKVITEILNTNLKGLGCLTIDEIKVLEKFRQVLIFSLKENEIV